MLIFVNKKSVSDPAGWKKTTHPGNCKIIFFNHKGKGRFKLHFLFISCKLSV